MCKTTMKEISWYLAIMDISKSFVYFLVSTIILERTETGFSLKQVIMNSIFHIEVHY
jgi:hypothetical protein